MEVARKSEPFLFTECDKSYKTKVALTDHMTHKHGAASTCTK